MSNAITQGFGQVAGGLWEQTKGHAELAKSVLTLDLKGATKAVDKMIEGGQTTARGLVNLTPAAMASNTLLDGHTDKTLKGFQDMGRAGINGALGQGASDLSAKV